MEGEREGWRETGGRERSENESESCRVRDTGRGCRMMGRMSREKEIGHVRNTNT